MAKMKVNFVNGVSADNVYVQIFDDAGGQILQEEYSYGYNASRTRVFENIARRDHDNAEKYGWSNYYPLKPFIGDILRDLIETYYIGNDDIEYGGYLIYSGRPMTKEEVQKMVDAIAEEV